MATFDEIKVEYEDGMSPAIRIGELITMVEELQAQVDRLTSRGIEDLHHENANLKAALKRVRKALVNESWNDGLDGCYQVFVGDVEAAIKGEE